MAGLLRRILGGGKSNADEPKKPESATPPPARPAPPKAQPPAVEPPPDSAALRRDAAVAQARDYRVRVQSKITKLAEDFAEGTINRTQFQELFGYYQKEMRGIEQLIDAREQNWRDSIHEGESIVIRRQHTAKAEGYAIYENGSGMPLATLGHFEVDPDLLVPLLSSYRSAAAEIFGGGMRSSAIEGGRWLCFVAGQHSTLMALFNLEPASRQLELLESIHSIFESANRNLLAHPPVDPGALVFPHEFFLGGLRKGGSVPQPTLPDGST